MFLLTPFGKPILNNLFSNFNRSKNIDQNEGNTNNFINTVASLILSCGGLLQFISVILVFMVFNSQKPPSNKMNLTVKNTSYIFYYKIYYIFAYILSIITFITITAIDNGYEDMIMKIFLIFITSAFIVIIYFMFNSGYQLYYNVIIKKNNLYQGVNNNNNNNINIDEKPTGSPEIENEPTISVPTTTLPVCTKSVNTGNTPDPYENCS